MSKDLIAKMSASLAKEVKFVSSKVLFMRAAKKNLTANTFIKALDTKTIVLQSVDAGWSEFYDLDQNEQFEIAGAVFKAISKKLSRSRAVDAPAEGDEFPYNIALVANPGDMLMVSKDYIVYKKGSFQLYPEVSPKSHPKLFTDAYERVQGGEFPIFNIVHSRSQKEVAEFHEAKDGRANCWWVNTYRFPEYMAIEPNPESKAHLVFRRYIEKVIANRSSRRRFYLWLKASLKGRARSMMVLVAPPGVGKTLLGEFCELLHGHANSCRLPLNFGEEKNNDIIFQKTLGFGDEFTVKKPETFESLKGMVEDTVYLDGKYRRGKVVKNTTSYVLTANPVTILPLGGMSHRKFDYIDMVKKCPGDDVLVPFLKACGKTTGKPDQEALRAFYDWIMSLRSEIDWGEDWVSRTSERACYETMGELKQWCIDIILGRLDPREELPILGEVRGVLTYSNLKDGWFSIDRRRKQFLRRDTLKHLVTTFTEGLEPIVEIFEEDDRDFSFICLQGPYAYVDDETEWGLE